MADPILSVLETDLRMLVAESKRGEGGNPLAGLFVSSQLPAIRESADKAANKIHSMISENKNVVTLLSSPVSRPTDHVRTGVPVLRPLLLTPPRPIARFRMLSSR